MAKQTKTVKYQNVTKSFRYVFNPSVFRNLQKLAQKDPKYKTFKNKPADTTFSMTIDINNKEKLDKQVKLSREIHVPTSFALSPEATDHERFFITAILEKIIKVMEYNAISDQKKYPLISNVIMELIENAEKEIIRNVATDFSITNLKKDYYLNQQIRAKLVNYARSKGKECLVKFIYSQNKFTIAISNNTYMNFAAQKNLENRANKGLKEGSSIAEQCKNDNNSIGAGIGLTMSKAILDGITKDTDASYKFGPEKDPNGYSIMKIDFLFDN
ncbi:MAG TPA: hypothetical protein VKS21_03425 [Spirochaetota bacterium]|nr:hypothetical protein [Spirochaetota bacterium]